MASNVKRLHLKRTQNKLGSQRGDYRLDLT